MIDPSAPPFCFWKLRASTTCSRLTRPILFSTRPSGRPLSWSTGGIGFEAAGEDMGESGVKTRGA